MTQPTLFDPPDPPDPSVPSDQAVRDFAVDPAHDVVLEASAGTGKTRVLVERYVRLIAARVDPRHILAVTFTRKAAAEMRDRVLSELRNRAARGELPGDVWTEISERIGDVQISTIDAFCFGLLREFPLEADVDPGFEIADETEMARFANEALDLAFRDARRLLGRDEHIRLLFARVKGPVLRDAIGTLLDRRHVALPAVAAFVNRLGPAATAAEVAAAFVARLSGLLQRSPHRQAFVEDGPRDAPDFRWLHAALSAIDEWPADDPARVQQLRREIERYVLTKARKARRRLVQTVSADQFPSADARRRHGQALAALSQPILDELDRLDADVNGLLARGLLRVMALAADRYERLLAEHALIDFAGMLDKSVTLLARQEEFARSRLKLQSRYHHLLVDEFQDTSRLQWRLIELLVDAWGEGEGAADAPTSIFVVGDRKQSIYRFRNADVTLLDEAARKIAALRPGRRVREAIQHSFRAVPELLAFVNALAGGMAEDSSLGDRFRYDPDDRFPAVTVEPGARRDGQPVLGVVAEASVPASAAAVACEISRLLDGGVVRDRHGTPRPVEADDIAILFRARAGHQYFEEALEARGVRTYVYKGLGFFDAPEVQDLQALIRFLAQPESDLRAAEFLRSRFVRLSDVGLLRLAPRLAEALSDPDFDVSATGLDDVDGPLLARVRQDVTRWTGLADLLPPSELLDLIVGESAYLFEMRGPRLDQARENVKKVRMLVRRVESRGYATIGRLASYFERLRAGEESNAIVGATGCVNLMTIHAAKGLEYPVVFVVNLHAGGRGRSSGFSLIEQGVDGHPEVAFGSTDGTALEDRREAAELRRLFYVAVTRARDRLYLAAEVDPNGRLRRPARSLAGLLPAGLPEMFSTAAATEQEEVEWTSEEQPFVFRVVRRPSGSDVHAMRPEARVPVPLDYQPLEPKGPAVVSATELGSVGPMAARDERGGEGRSDQRLIGTLVHRLFQRDLDPSLDPDAVRRLVPMLVDRAERVDVGDPSALAEAAARLYVDLRRRPDLVEILGAGERYYEVPFSYLPPDEPRRLVRGVVDCLVVAPGGSVTILELKTGEPRPEHHEQAAVYAAAIRHVVGHDDVDVKIVYP